MRFERADAADIEALTALRLAYLAEDRGLTDAEAAALRERLPGYFARHLDRDLRGYIAREGGEAAACVLLLVVEKPMSPAFPNGMTGTVLNVYTRPDFRRGGCAKRLMALLMADATAMGLSVVELKATACGHPLYRSLGFQDSGSEYRAMRWTPEANPSQRKRGLP